MPFKKVRAFTVVEVVVVMVLSAIVISISYTSFGLFSRQFSRFKNKSSELSRLLQLQTALTKDWSEAESITFQKGDLNMYKRDTGDHHVIAILYVFKDSLLVRQLPARAPDTFFLKVSPPAIELQDSTEDSDPALPVIKGLGFTVTSKSLKTYPFHFQKKYPAVFFINSTYKDFNRP